MQSRFYLRLSSVLLLSTTLFSCAKFGHVNKPEIETLEKQPYVFTSVGYAPIVIQKGATFDLQVLNAIKASKLEAYNELAEQIHGVLLSAKNNVKGARLDNDIINSEVKGLVRGARVLKSYHEGDVYITELELSMKTLPLLKEFDNNRRVSHLGNQVYY